jgi:hypothetical protein
MAKRLIPRALFEPFADLQASDLLDNEPLINLIRNEAPDAIEEAFLNKKTFATLFEVNTTGYFLDIPKMYWVDALEECIKLNLVEEKYEECLRLNKLIEKIKIAPRKSIKQKKNGERVNGDTACDQ